MVLGRTAFSPFASVSSDGSSSILGIGSHKYALPSSSSNKGPVGLPCLFPTGGSPPVLDWRSMLGDTAQLKVPEPTVQFKLEESGRVGRLPPVQNCLAPGVCPLEAVLVTPGIAVKTLTVAGGVGAGRSAAADGGEPGYAAAAREGVGSKAAASGAVAGETGGAGVVVKAGPTVGQLQGLLSAQMQRDPGSRAAVLAMQKLDKAVAQLGTEVGLCDRHPCSGGAIKARGMFIAALCSHWLQAVPTKMHTG